MKIDETMVNRTTNMTALKPCTDRSAFTLVEIMVTIIVLSILSSLVLFAMTGVLEMAKETQTKSRIAKLDREISRLWNGYLSRRVPLQLDRSLPRQVAAQARLVALRDLMRLEMPDRVTDVTVPPAVDFNGDGDINDADRPAASKAYKDIADATSWDDKHQGAECLYMIVQFNVGTGTRGRSFFSESEVGDLDEDGMPEFLDAWGQPIRFLRWAPGLNSPLQDQDPNQPDPFDPQGVDDLFDPAMSGDARFPLYPYIVSAGSNRQSGTVFGSSVSNQQLTYRQEVPSRHLYLEYYIDPYMRTPQGDLLGSIVSSAPDAAFESSDDIHNHLVETN